MDTQTFARHRSLVEEVRGSSSFGGCSDLWKQKEQHNRGAPKKNVIGKKPSTIAPFPKQQRKRSHREMDLATTTSTFRIVLEVKEKSVKIKKK